MPVVRPDAERGHDTLDVVDLPLCTRHAHEKGTHCEFKGVNLSMFVAKELVMNPIEQRNGDSPSCVAPKTVSVRTSERLR